MDKWRELGFVMLLVASSGCSLPAPALDSRTELVLKPGDTIVAMTRDGAIRAEATSELERHYTWKGRDRTVALRAAWEPRDGIIGASAAAIGIGPFGSDTNATEESYNFSSLRDLKYYLSWGRIRAYSSDGYGVGFGISYNGTNNVQVERLCVNHKPPVGLAPPSGTSVKMFFGHEHQELAAWYGCARGVYDPSGIALADIRSSLTISRSVDFFYRGNEKCSIIEEPRLRKSEPGKNQAAAFPREEQTALQPGASLSFSNANGELYIEALNTYTRIVRWHNKIAKSSDFSPALDTIARSETLMLGAESADNGKLGSIGCSWSAGDNHYAVALDEATLNFRDLADFRSFVRWDTHGPLYLDYAYRHDGLLVGFVVDLDSGNAPMLNVDIFRVCVAGRSAKMLPGAVDGRVRVALGRPRATLASGSSCPAGVLDVAGIYARKLHQGELDTADEQSLRAYLAGK